MTPAERALWQELRCRKLGVMFRRQEPVSGYIVDFYASPVQVAVEVDGSVHDQQRAYDEKRNDKLHTLGVRVLRFRNEDVFSDRERVVARIREIVDERLQSMPFKVTRVHVRPSAPALGHRPSHINRQFAPTASPSRGRSRPLTRVE